MQRTNGPLTYRNSRQADFRPLTSGHRLLSAQTSGGGVLHRLPDTAFRRPSPDANFSKQTSGALCPDAAYAADAANVEWGPVAVPTGLGESHYPRAGGWAWPHGRALGWCLGKTRMRLRKPRTHRGPGSSGLVPQMSHQLFWAPARLSHPDLCRPWPCHVPSNAL